MDIKERIDDTILYGRVALRTDEAQALYDACKNIDMYLEIGTLWGGSAICAGLAGARRIITIDKMEGGFWESYDPLHGETPSEDRIIMNLERFGQLEKTTILKRNSYPFPLKDIQPDVSLIDGDHTEEGCLRDWDSLKGITKKIILIHDCDGAHLPVMEAVKFIKENDPEWELDKVVETLAIFRRKP